MLKASQDCCSNGVQLSEALRCAGTWPVCATQRLVRDTGLAFPQVSVWGKDFPLAQMVKNLSVRQETRVQFLWLREWQSTPVFLPGEFHGQRSLAAYKSVGSLRVRHD